MHKRTKALSISKKVKKIVWKRDHERCILCGSPSANPEAHYIPRSQGGLGIEQNIVTLCRLCHERMDQTIYRYKLLKEVKSYLDSIYPDFNDYERIYRK